MEGAVTGTSNFNSFRASTLNLYIYQRKMDRDIEVLNTELKHGFKTLQLPSDCAFKAWFSLAKA